MSESNLQGTITENPLNLKNWNVKEISIRIGGRSLPWKTGLECDFAASNYASAYLALLNEGTFHNKEIPITYTAFDAGYSIFSFDCTAGHDQLIDKNEEKVSQRLEGNVELSCVFGAAPAVPIVFVVLCYFPSSVLIDTSRKAQLVDMPMTTSSVASSQLKRSF